MKIFEIIVTSWNGGGGILIWVVIGQLSLYKDNGSAESSAKIGSAKITTLIYMYIHTYMYKVTGYNVDK